MGEDEGDIERGLPPVGDFVIEEQQAARRGHQQVLRAEVAVDETDARVQEPLGQRGQLLRELGMPRRGMGQVRLHAQLDEERPVGERSRELGLRRRTCMNAAQELTGGPCDLGLDVAAHQGCLPRVGTRRSARHRECMGVGHDPQHRQHGPGHQPGEHGRAPGLDAGPLGPREPRLARA